ncbi:hypothetical protein OQA88_5812 [Cercophora sp. LCS_1]
MTESQRDEALKSPGIKGIEPNTPLTPSSVMMKPAERVDIPSKAKRAFDFDTQRDAVTELVSISQPSTVPDASPLKNYVFESNNGRKSFVYHVEFGVAFRNHPEEFPNVADTHIFTQKARALGRRAEGDNSVPAFHSTCTAGRAVGQQYGAAKKATLVVVVMGEYHLLEMISAFSELLAHFRENPERRGASVITMSLSGPIFQPSIILQVTLLAETIGEILALGVPVAVSAGNDARIPRRENVDTVPGIFAGQAYPLIGGPQVTLHAVGEGVTCLMDGDIPGTKTGTSYAVPLVAAEVADLLSYDDVPFPTDDGQLAYHVRDYLVSDASSWARRGNICADHTCVNKP